MSLDVTLIMTSVMRPVADAKIYVRENGQTKAITPEEWQERYPGTEPVVFTPSTNEEVFDYNITHNLCKMAREARVDARLWRPDELGITKARELIEPLTIGLAELRTQPEHYKTFNPENGWGDYGGLVRFVEAYLAACTEWPDAEISVSR